MDQPEITKLTRRGIREPRPVLVSDDEIVNMTIEGVYYLGATLKTLDPSLYNTRKSIASNTHLFSKPSDCLNILRVWDLGTTAGTITNASNASPIVITCADHGFSDDAIITIHDVGGNTAANGTFLTTAIDDDSFSLDGSTGNAAWTSGGKCYEVVQDPDKIEKINLEDSTNSDDSAWYPRDDYIVVDDDDFTNDILLDYVKSPTAITDIPAEYHMALAAWNVINLIIVPPHTDPDYADRTGSLKRNEALLSRLEAQIRKTFKVSSEPTHITQELNLDDYTY